MLGPWIKVNGYGQIGDGKTEHQHFSYQWTKNGQEWANSIQMTITSTSVGKNPTEETE